MNAAELKKHFIFIIALPAFHQKYLWDLSYSNLNGDIAFYDNYIDFFSLYLCFSAIESLEEVFFHKKNFA